MSGCLYCKISCTRKTCSFMWTYMCCTAYNKAEMLNVCLFVTRYGSKIVALNGRSARRRLQFYVLLPQFFRLTWLRHTTLAPWGTPCVPSTTITDGPPQWAQQCQQWLRSPLLLYHFRPRTTHSRRGTRCFNNRTRTRHPCLGHISACPSNNKSIHKSSRPFNSHLSAPGKCPFRLRHLYKISSAVFPMAGSCGVGRV